MRLITAIGVGGAVIGGLATGTLMGILIGWSLGETTDYLFCRAVKARRRAAAAAPLERAT